jgi:oligopeptide/dipeptide ABC transporter ATP-binding protein
VTTTAALEVAHLTCTVDNSGHAFAVVRDVSLVLYPGEMLGLVGESGSGKSMLSLAILGLLPAPQSRIAAGSIYFAGHDLAAASEAQLQQVRGHHIAMVFQDPMTSLNPLLSIGRQLTEVWEAHQPHRAQEARARAIAVLQEVGIERAAERLADYPHRFSGGMRQRVMIAMALLCTPAVLIADEPTTALDVTVQAQILDLLVRLQAQHKTAVMLISHDLAVVASRAQRIAVMYAGRIVECGTANAVYTQPQHPYTAALLACSPRLDSPGRTRLVPIPGQPAHSAALPSGCAFRPRCGRAQAICADIDPPLVALHNAVHQAPGAPHAIACHNPQPLPAAS